MASVEKITGAGRPEPTTYDKVRHESMKLRPIGYGYFHVNRSFSTVTCNGCGNEINGLVGYYINKKPYHRECFLKA